MEDVAKVLCNVGHTPCPTLGTHLVQRWASTLPKVE